MKTTIEVVIALLPIAMLFVAFLVMKLNAFRASLYALILELAVVLTYYQQPPLKGHRVRNPAFRIRPSVLAPQQSRQLRDV
jgi:hypothetical protein